MPLSKIAYCLCAGFLLYTSFIFFPKWKQPGGENTISWDAAGYYWYLPSTFIYHDLKQQKFNDSIFIKYKPADNLQGTYKLENGNYVIRYTCGMAVMEMPFFFAANILAKPLGYPQDGFSPPYPLAIQIGGILIALIGLWYLRKLLLLFYSDVVTAICLLLLIVGTNYLDFAAINVGMTHNWLFTIYVFILLNTYYFYQQYAYKYAIRIGLLIGLATLTRPTEIIAIMIPIFWGLENVSIKGIQNRIILFAEQWKKIFAASCCGIAVISIQLFYWKYISGHWFVYSYRDQGFSWLHPHIKVYAFNFRTGWLNYTPMMLFAIAGIIPFFKNGKNKVAILLFLAVNYYVVCAWSQWWYGGRAMIQSYPVWIFPFASFIEIALNKRVLKWITALCAILFLYFNIWLTYHEHRGTMYTPDNMTKAYYMRVVGRWSVPDETLKLRDNPDLFEGNPKNMQLLYSNNFNDDTSIYCPLHAIEGARSIYLDKDHQGSKIFKFAYKKEKAEWVRAQATFKCISKEWGLWNIPQFVVHFYNKNDEVKTSMIRVDRFLDPGETKDLYIDIRAPKSEFDSIGVSFWNADSDKELQVDNLKVWSFEE